jgi:hypothetical protein
LARAAGRRVFLLFIDINVYASLQYLSDKDVYFSSGGEASFA